MAATPESLDFSRAAYCPTLGGWVGVPEPSPKEPGLEWCTDPGPGSGIIPPEAEPEAEI